MSRIESIDTRITESLNGFLFRHDLAEDPILNFERLSIAIFILIVASLLIGGLFSRHVWRMRAGVSALAAAGLGLLVTHFLSLLVDRPRPFVAHPDAIHTFASHAADAGFPSDHATAAFAIGTAIALRNRAWGAFVLVLAVMLCVGRVAIGVHYPSDVIGGALIGTLAALLLWIHPLRDRLDRLADETRERFARRTYGSSELPA